MAPRLHAENARVSDSDHYEVLADISVQRFFRIRLGENFGESFRNYLFLLVLLWYRGLREECDSEILKSGVSYFSRLILKIEFSPFLFIFNLDIMQFM